MFRIRPKLLILCIFLCLSGPVTTFAEEVKTETANEASWAKQHLSVFGGNTQEESDIALSIGIEYEYRWLQRFGIGAFIEYAGGTFRDWVVGIPFLLHPHAGWLIRLAPGWEFEDGESGIIFRTGIGYDFEIMPRWSLAPEFNVDFVEGGDNKMVYGLSISREF